MWCLQRGAAYLKCYCCNLDCILSNHSWHRQNFLQVLLHHIKVNKQAHTQHTVCHERSIKSADLPVKHQRQLTCSEKQSVSSWMDGSHLAEEMSNCMPLLRGQASQEVTVDLLGQVSTAVHNGAQQVADGVSCLGLARSRLCSDVCTLSCCAGTAL